MTYVFSGAVRGLVVEVVIKCFILGAAAAFGLCLALHGLLCVDSAAQFALGTYIIVIPVVFHLTEFLVALLYRPHEAHPDAFMMYHSSMYQVALLVSLAEFFVEACFIPESYKLSPTTFPVLAFCFRLNVYGSCLFALLSSLAYAVRMVGMIQCGSNFSLRIEDERRASHVLVQHGVYSVLRHPSYFGWFWRTVFSQLILANPLSFVVHTAITWRFFQKRIPLEESILSREDFFGKSYAAYKSKTHVGIPLL